MSNAFRVRADGDTWLGALLVAEDIVPHYERHPEAYSVMIEGHDGALHVIGQDRTTSVQVTVPGSVAAAGLAIVHPVSLEMELCRLPPGDVDRVFDRVPTNTHAVHRPFAAAATIDRGTFRDGIQHALDAAGTDALDPQHHGVRFTVERDGVVIVGAEPFRITVRRVPAVVDPWAVGATALASGALLRRLSDHLNGDGVDVGVGTLRGARHLSLVSGDLTVVTRSVHDEPVAWRKALIEKPTFSETVIRSALADAVQTVTPNTCPRGDVLVDLGAKPVAVTAAPDGTRSRGRAIVVDADRLLVALAAFGSCPDVAIHVATEWPRQRVQVTPPDVTLGDITHRHAVVVQRSNPHYKPA